MTSHENEPIGGPASVSDDLDVRMAGIWSSVLGLDVVGMDEGFLVLGGESLLAAQVAARVTEEFGITLPLRSVFLGTVATTAAEVRRQLGSAVEGP